VPALRGAGTVLPRLAAGPTARLVGVRAAAAGAKPPAAVLAVPQPAIPAPGGPRRQGAFAIRLAGRDGPGRSGVRGPAHATRNSRSPGKGQVE
jgi:hypothetical protein